MENVASQTSHAEAIALDAAVLPWILSRIQQKEAVVSQNKQYAAEVLAILLQSSSSNRKKFIELDGIDLILQILSSYRKRDPAKESDEEEFAENLFDSLICLVEEDSGKTKFVEAEGIELALIMLKEGKFSKPRALRVLDHALGGVGGAPACEKLVEAAGLKTVFGMFLKKVGSNPSGESTKSNVYIARRSSCRTLPRDLCFASTSPSRGFCTAHPNIGQVHGKGLC